MFVHFVLCIFQANVQNGGSVPAQFSKLSLFRLWWFGAATFLLLVTQQARYIEGISLCCSSASALRLLLLLDNTKPIGEEIRWSAKKWWFGWFEETLCLDRKVSISDVKLLQSLEVKIEINGPANGTTSKFQQNKKAFFMCAHFSSNLQIVLPKVWSSKFCACVYSFIWNATEMDVTIFPFPVMRSNFFAKNRHLKKGNASIVAWFLLLVLTWPTAGG